MKSVLFRADASRAIGSGHVMRCVALAHAFRAARVRTTFAVNDESMPYVSRIEAAGAAVARIGSARGSVEDADATVEVARRVGATWVVVDGYEFRRDWLRRLRPHVRVAAIDDHGRMGHHPVDVVVDQNLGAAASHYRAAADGARLLLGPRFALLRDEFTSSPPQAREAPAVVRRVLVSLGGSDPNNHTLAVLKALASVSADVERVTALVGAQNPHRETLQRWCASRSGFQTMTDVQHVRPLMEASDLAIVASGSVSWELAYLGLPFVALVTAKNQAPVAAALAANEVTVAVESAAASDPTSIAAALRPLLRDANRRAAMSANGQRIVDGKGSARVVRALIRAEISLEPAAERDAKTLWTWANETAVRENAFQTANIPWEDHVRWYERRLGDPQCKMFIAVAPDGVRIGQVRFDVEGEIALIDLSVDAALRGGGLGSAILDAATEALFASPGPRIARGVVKTSNSPSVATFRRAGYIERRTGTFDGSEAIVFERTRDDPAAPDFGVVHRASILTREGFP